MGSGGRQSPPPRARATAKTKASSPSSWRWWLGLAQASVFSLIYFVAPIYILSVLGSTVWYGRKLFEAPVWFWCYSAPLWISIALPPIPWPWMVRQLTPMLEYFDSFEIIHETQPIDTVKNVVQNNQNYILCFQPHGVVSYTGILSAVAADPAHMCRIPTAVADIVLQAPILKHVMGIFNLISASKKSLVRNLTTRKGLEGCTVLYVGGMAELFLSCGNEERLYLKQRKGFVKIALQTGIDIIPVYLFGNTHVLSVAKSTWLETLSRKLGISLTYMWGKWYLPIPRNDCKLLYVSGQPIGIPHIPHPTQADIDLYHEKYCQEITRIYDKYKEKVPEHKHKKLHIM